MLLAIDIGNTTTKFGVFDGEILVHRFSIPTIRSQTAHELDSLISERLTYPIEFVMIASVVSEVRETYQNFCETAYNLKPVFVDSTFNFGFTIKYQPPENLGIDRAVAAFAAVQKYEKPCITCDFGTATTIDIVNSNNEFLGGIIVAGINVVADSLFGRTSKLPKIEVVKCEKVIGNSTISAIQSGVYFGYIGLVEGIITRMFAELGEKPKVIATGGFAELIADGTNFIDLVDETLVLEGLNLLSLKNKRT